MVGTRARDCNASGRVEARRDGLASALVCEDTVMPRIPFFLIGRRAGPVGLVLTAWDIWRRLPPKQRRRILDATRKHGPRIASQAAKRQRSRRVPKP